MVGGGCLGDAAQTKQKEDGFICRPQSELFAVKPDIKWCKQAVTSFNPDQNQFKLADGTDVTYEYMVVAPGLELRWDMIKGAREALDDESCPVGSIYSLESAYKTNQMKCNFK